ncbi:MFS transporter [Microbacterium neungamense]|uniref:MFS transporter n=1 Tax=Microbacterium TaxID=33882 RepID=UPI00217E971D|nr:MULTISPECIES: MFS transporter [Microbacterium]UWF78567.1 MFS transporter [Microbacterium neungamense]WCM56743.1 MFS transporter [Microbacterium sp. EF45047]
MSGGRPPSSSTGRPLWRGRALAVLGILLCAFSLRSAVASLSPVIDHIAADFPLPSAVVGVIGTLPPVCFAVFGLLTPILERWLGLERLTIVALTAITAGLLLRGLAGDATTLLLATALVFAGVGMGNILLPPLVKAHFPDRIGVMMTLYTTAMAVSTFVPPLVAVPVADAAGWRVSLALWAVFAVAGVIPWLVMLVQQRGGAAASSSAESVVAPASPGARPAGEDETPAHPRSDVTATGPIATSPENRWLFARLLRLPLVWALAVTFGTSATMAYVAFAWLPAILIDVSGVSAATAGLLLSLFALIGLPASMLVPVLVVRFQATRPLFLLGALGGAGGLVGLLIAPTPALLWLWVVLYGLAGLLFPLSLVLISIRSRTAESAVLLSSLVQSVGYTVAAIFPVLVGVLHEATGGWAVPLLVIVALLLGAIPAGMMAGRRGTVEDEWERRHGPW